MVLYALGNVYVKSERIDEAIISYSESLALYQSKYAGSHHSIGDSSYKMAHLWLRKGNINEAQ
jgi:tetratricopeptide (TPR) repeat protein